jgi:hypothetical protein
MRSATKKDIDIFMEKAILDDSIYPYLSTDKHMSSMEPLEGDWNGLLLTNDTNTYICKISFRRADELGMSISLWANTAFSAGKAVSVIKEVIKRYKPRYIESVVHASNIKSIKLNTKLLGEPWGREPGGAWKSKLGEYEELVYFRKLLK